MLFDVGDAVYESPFWGLSGGSRSSACSKKPTSSYEGKEMGSSLSSRSSAGASSDKLLAGVEENEGAVESAWSVLGDDSVDEVGELDGDDIRLPRPRVLFDLARLEYPAGWVTNLGCEWDRRSALEEKKLLSSDGSTTAIAEGGLGGAEAQEHRSKKPLRRGC